MMNFQICCITILGPFQHLPRIRRKFGFVISAALCLFEKRAQRQDSFDARCFRSQKKRHKAVHRNRIKRVVREAYRLEKQLFLDSMEAPYIGMLLYQGKQSSDQALVHSKIKAIAAKFSDKIKEESTNASLSEPNKKH